MKYLALTSKGNIRDLGDCGHLECANEIAEEYICGENAIFVADIKYWKMLSSHIEINYKTKRGVIKWVK